MPYPDYPLPPDENQRLRDLERQGVLDQPGDEHFDRLVTLTASVLDAPIALISLVDRDRQWFLARHGLEIKETPRQMAFCAHAIAGDETLVVPDASQDQRFNTNPLVTAEPNIRFYAGTPLQSREGHNLGTLCVVDREPRQFGPKQVTLLEEMAQLVLRELELRRKLTVNPLTGLANRACFLEQAQPELERARADRQPLAMLVLELDRFSQVRIRWGLEVSDQALHDVGACLQAQHRPQDLLGQIGDQSFAMLMVDVDQVAALERAEAIRTGIADLGGAYRTRDHQLSASCGLTLLAPEDVRPQELLLRAERALFLAQGNGHNQVALMLQDP
jgi:diguanylate cyclase (GGDEF)-like protein